MYDKLLELIKKQKDFEKICKKLELKDYELYGLVEMLKNKGVNISIFNDDGTKKVLYYEKIIIPEDNEIKIETREKLIRLGIVSDTHACCHYQQMSLLNTAYKDFYNRKIKTVLHVGDLSDGDYRNRPDHLYSLFKIGASEQAEYIADMYPRVNSMQTYFLQGSHDDTHIKNGGADIGKMISSVRPDMINLGHGQAFFKINGVNIELLHPGGGSCFDDETEIMTKDGWKLFKHLIKSDYVATMTKDNNMFEWQQPREITNEEYDGDMYYIKSRTVDMAVTPNHGLWACRYEKGINRLKECIMQSKSHKTLDLDWQRVDAKELCGKEYRRQRWQMTRVCNGWVGKNKKFIEVTRLEPQNKCMLSRMIHVGKVNFELFAEFVAWYVTEGYADKKSVTIAQSLRVNPKEHKRITNLIEKMGLKYCISGLDSKSITISSKELAEFMKKECGHLSSNKYLPDYIKNATKRILKKVFFTMIDGDGWYGKTGYGYKSISKRLRNDFMEIAVKLGYAVSEYKDIVNVSYIQTTPTINKKPIKKNYKGKIYCCNVKNGLIFVRRNGKTIWSHNSYAYSYKPQKIIDSIRGGEKPQIILIGHYHKNLYMVYRNIHCLLVPSLEATTPFMTSNALINDIGYNIIEFRLDERHDVKSFKTEYIPFYTTIKDDYKKVKRLKI